MRPRGFWVGIRDMPNSKPILRSLASCPTSVVLTIGPCWIGGSITGACWKMANLTRGVPCWLPILAICARCIADDGQLLWGKAEPQCVLVGKSGYVVENEGADALGDVLSMWKWHLAIFKNIFEHLLVPVLNNTIQAPTCGMAPHVGAWTFI